MMTGLHCVFSLEEGSVTTAFNLRLGLRAGARFRVLAQSRQTFPAVMITGTGTAYQSTPPLRVRAE